MQSHGIPPIVSEPSKCLDVVHNPDTFTLNGIDTVNLAEDDHALAAAFHTLHAVTNTVTWDMVKEATAMDEVLSELIPILQDGMPRCQDLPPSLRLFHHYATSLSCLDGVVLMGHRIIIPTSLRKNILSSLHAAHQGVGAMSTSCRLSVLAWYNN